MEQVAFTSRHGLRLAGHLWRAGPAGVVLAHGFCNDKSSNGRFDRLGAALQAAGMSALAFDFAGCGASDDALLDAGGMIADLAAAVSFLRSTGAAPVGLFGNSLGGSICLKAALPDIAAIVTSGAALGAMPYEWSEHFSLDQLAELEETGVFDEAVESTWRRQVSIGAAMLEDFTDPARAVRPEALGCPVLLLYGDDPRDDEEQALLALARATLPRLPAGSAVETVPGGKHGLRETWDPAMARIVDWLCARLKR
jgi:alpha-beta hydrolase superfamily lysophospholipase